MRSTWHRRARETGPKKTWFGEPKRWAIGVALDLTDVLRTSGEPSSQGKHQDLADRLYEHISRAILAQQLRPGLKLGEEKLSKIFKVGRPVVRRALTKLAQDRVVEIKPNRGAFIAKPSASRAREVFEARRVLEQATTQACVRMATDRDIEALRAHVAIEDECANRGERATWIRLSGEFHLVLARVGGNEVMEWILKDLIAQTSLIIGLYGNRGRSICHNGEHEELVDAIAARDEKKAVDLMLTHLLECEAALIIDEDQDEADLDAIFAGLEGAP